MGEPTISEYWIGEGGRCQLNYNFLANRTKIEIKINIWDGFMFRIRTAMAPLSLNFFFSNIFLNAFIVYLFLKIIL